MAFPLTSDGTFSPEQIGFFTHGTLPGVTILSLNSGVSLCGFDIQNTGTDLAVLLFPRLTAIDPDNLTGGAAVMTINGNSRIEVVGFPWLETSRAPLVITNNGSLTSVSLPFWQPFNGQIVNFGTNALDQASVDNVLYRCWTNGTYVSGEVHLEGTTNSTPSATGLDYAGTLTTRGVSVFHN